MGRTKPVLPTDTKLDYTTLDGVPTINIAATLTTQTQVSAMIKQLEKLGFMLPEIRTRKAKAKSKNGRTTRQTTHTEEKTV